MAKPDENALLLKLIELKKEKFNELATEVELSEEELGAFKFNSEEDVDTAIQSLKLIRSRQNAWKEAFGTKKEGFFVPKVATKAKINEDAAKKENEGAGAKEPEKKFNFLQLFGERFAPSVEGMKYNTDCEVIRLYQNPNDKLGRLL